MSSSQSSRHIELLDATAGIQALRISEQEELGGKRKKDVGAKKKANAIKEGLN